MDKPIDNHGNPFTAQYVSGVAITPSGTTTADAYNAIYVGGAGDVAVQFATGGSEVATAVTTLYGGL